MTLKQACVTVTEKDLNGRGWNLDVLMPMIRMMTTRPLKAASDCCLTSMQDLFQYTRMM